MTPSPSLNVIALCLIFLFMPETKQLSLEALDDVFSVPTKTFIQHNVKHEIPYIIQRGLLCNKNARMQPLLVSDDGSEYEVGRIDSEEKV